MNELPGWQAGFRLERASLRGARRADVVIVGGGLTGVTTALLLSRQGARVTLLEAHHLGDGATYACAGTVTSQLPQVYRTALALSGAERTTVLCRLVRGAVDGVRTLVQKGVIPCHWRETRVYVYADDEERPLLQRLMKAEQRLRLPVTPALDLDDCPIPAAHALRLDHQGQLSPMLYLLGLAEEAERLGCRIYEESPAAAISDGRVSTPEGHVDAAAVILATAAPAGCRSLPRLAMLTQRVRVLHQLTSATPLHNSFLPLSPDGIAFAPCPDGLLAVQDVGLVGQRDQEKRILLAEDTLRDLLPDAAVQERLLRQECVSADGLPLIGALHPQHDRLLIASGYSGWGVALSYLAATLLSGHLTGHPLSEAPLFVPFRITDGRHPVLRPGLRRMAAAYLGGLSRPYAPRCPHMGGRLRYDPQTAQWVCPCHGSTFSTMGRVICAPATEAAVIRRRHHPYG